MISPCETNGGTLVCTYMPKTTRWTVKVDLETAVSNSGQVFRDALRVSLPKTASATMPPVVTWKR